MRPHNQRPSDRVEFFLKHAGYSYHTGASELEKSAERLANAENLARAEMTAESLGWTVELEDEQEAWDGDCEAPAYCFCVCIKDADGKYLNSLGMVGVESHRDPYLRVVEAELYMQAIDDRATEQAKEMAGRATFAGPAGDKALYDNHADDGRRER
jgi:hypothetical protein